MRTSSHTPPSIVTEAAAFIGIDYHKKYSVWHAVDAAGTDLGKGRIEHHSPQDFATLVKRFASTRMGEGMTTNGREDRNPFFRLLRFFRPTQGWDGKMPSLLGFTEVMSFNANEGRNDNEWART